MKKTIAIVVCLVLVAALFAGCGKTPEPANTGTPAPTDAVVSETPEEVYVEIAGQKIEPLPEKTKVVFSTVGSSAHALPLYVAEEMGWLDELNIDLEMLSFDNGPIQLEAMASNSWDFGSTGQGGIFSGVIKYETTIMADVCSDDDGMRIWARADSPIVQAGKGHIEGYPEIYGTPEIWRDAEVLVPAGTIAHFVLAKTIDKIGLSMDDINVVNMSASNAKTALDAGQGDIASLMSGAAYSFVGNDDFVQISSANAVGGAGAIAMMIINPSVVEDQAKMDAILKCMDVHFAVVDYMNSIPFEDVVQAELNMTEFYGLSRTLENATEYMSGTKLYTFDESYDRQTTISDDGKFTIVERSIIDPLKFFVLLGNFTEQDVEIMSGGYFPVTYMEALKAVRE